MTPKVDIKKIIDLRQKLHKFPHVSGEEQPTAQIIKHFFERYKPAKVLDLSGGSLAFAFGPDDLPAIVFRAELDALPIDEHLQLPYASVNPGVSHKCGHDGHMAILAGLAEAIVRNAKIQNLRPVFLYQAAEETLQGAVDVLSDEQFVKLNPQIFIGFHNVPGYPLNSLVIKPEEITAYVTGLRVEFTGQSAHAADAQKNMSLAVALMRVIQYLHKEFSALPISKKTDVSITHLSYGQPTFGISPNRAVVHLTLRAYNNDDLEEVIELLENQLKLIAITNGLKWDFSYVEDAPAVFNNPNLVELAKQVATKLNMQIIELDKPFAWGEDFGYYTVRYKGMLMGIGAGNTAAQLHTDSYDFPDEIIYPTIELLFNLYLSLSGQN